MNEFTIYCTSEQTKKAFELGAHIEKDCSNLRHDTSRTTYINDIYYCLPTAEQIIGWLEGQCEFKVIAIHNSKNLDWSFHITTKDKDVFTSIGYTSRKEATLAAIDAALEYLTNKNK